MLTILCDFNIDNNKYNMLTSTIQQSEQYDSYTYSEFYVYGMATLKTQQEFQNI